MIYFYLNTGTVSFYYAGEKLWNSLPIEVGMKDILTTFKSKSLK